MIGFEITVNHIVFYHTATFWILSHDVQCPPIALQNITIVTNQHHLHHAPGHGIRTSTSHQHHPHQNNNLIIMARTKNTARYTRVKAPDKLLTRAMSLRSKPSTSLAGVCARESLLYKYSQAVHGWGICWCRVSGWGAWAGVLVQNLTSSYCTNFLLHLRFSGIFWVPGNK